MTGTLSAIQTSVSFDRVCGLTIETVWYPTLDPNAATLVFLHEGLGSVALWRDFPKTLSHTVECNAFVYSRVGNGRSSARTAPFTPDYMHREALDFLPELLDQRHIDNPILIGHSDGASIALIHAAAGRRVRGVIVEAPHVFVEDVTIASIKKAKDAFETTELKEKLGRYHEDPEMTFYGWNNIWLHPPFRYWDIANHLPRIHCPVLAIQGADDEYGTLSQIEAIERGTGGTFEKLILDACGHSPHRDQFECVLAAMAGFIRDITEASH